MKCPICPEAMLVMTERSGIEIDYCPQCRGVWLDRGELDKIIDRAAATATPVAETPSGNVPQPSSTLLPSSIPPMGSQRPPASGMNIPSVLRDVVGEVSRRRDHDDDDRRYRRDYDDDDYKRRKKKKSGFLGELFDFD